MKAPILFALLAGLQLAVADSTNHQFRLSGIVDLPGLKLAVIEETRKASGTVHKALWTEGERDGDLAIRTITPEAGSVVGAINKTNPVTLRLGNTPTRSTSPQTIQFDNVSLNSLLAFYGRLSQRSLLQSPRLPRASFSAQTDTTNRNEVLGLLERLLLDHEISMIRDGEKFVAVLPRTEAARFEPRAPAESKETSDSSEVFPAGSINFRSASLPNCLLIYAEFAGKELDRTSLMTLPDLGPIIFYNYNALTRAECSYALETLLRMQGVELQPSSNKLVRAVFIPEAAR
jgi:hypothetical protein